MSDLKSVQDAFVIQLVCPICSDGCVTQEMIQYGDFPDWMFCPHCDVVIPTPVPLADSKGKHLLYMEHQAKEFIKRWKDENDRCSNDSKKQISTGEKKENDVHGSSEAGNA